MAGTRSGRTNDVSSRSTTPARTRASKRAQLVVGRDDALVLQAVAEGHVAQAHAVMTALRDDAGGVQLVELGRVEAEQLGQHLVGVLAEPGTGMADARRASP